MGSLGSVWVAVVLDIALRNQRSEVRILSGVFSSLPLSSFSALDFLNIVIHSIWLVGKNLTVGGQGSGQNFRDRFRQRFSGTFNVVVVRMHIDVGCCRHARMPKLQLCQFHITRYRTNDAAARMTEDAPGIFC